MKGKSNGGLLLTAMLLLLLATGVGYAQGPGSSPVGTPETAPDAAVGPGFTYQGRLKDGSGNPIDDTCNLTLSLWDAESAGSQVGGNCVVSGVIVTDGYFAARVNQGGEFGGAAFDGQARWLAIAVQCSGDAAPVPLSPRQLLSAAPYAHYALSTGALQGYPVDTTGPMDSDVLQWDGFAKLWSVRSASNHSHVGQYWLGSGDTGLRLDGNAIGLQADGYTYGVYGTSADTAGSGVYGQASAASGFNTGVHGQSASTTGRGVYGQATAASGTTYGVYGETGSSSGVGVYGYNTATSSGGAGVLGQSDATAGTGVWGYAHANSGETRGVLGFAASLAGRGVEGLATSTVGPTYGVRGQSSSNAGTGVYGLAGATSGTTYGVYGQSNATGGTGVHGLAGATSGTTYGVYGQSASTHGHGVYGYASATGGVTYGVFGLADSDGGVGVYGRGLYGLEGWSTLPNGRGVYGYATGTLGYTYGVYGLSSSTEGRGVFGDASSASGTTYGVFGRSSSPDGRGVYGRAVAASGTTYGVYGLSDSNAGYGVYAYASATSGPTYGVMGVANSPSGYGGWFGGRLYAQAAINSTAQPGNHVAQIVNTATGDSPDVLALKVGYTGNPGDAINFITFFNGNDTGLGSIEGNGSGGITYKSGSADYAEFLPRLNPREEIAPGDVVGVWNGAVSKATAGAAQVLVVSSRPIVLGNDPGEGNEAGYEKVAFLGQVAVQVRGPVAAGDYLVPSGLEDGSAVAVAPTAITAEQFAQVIGQAWAASADPGLKLVPAVVGLAQADPAVARMAGRIQELEGTISWLEARLAALEQAAAGCSAPAGILEVAP